MSQGEAEVPAPARLGAVQGSEPTSSGSADLHSHQAGLVTAQKHWMLHDISNSPLAIRGLVPSISF